MLNDIEIESYITYKMKILSLTLKLMVSSHQVRRRLYHEYAHSADYSVPDIVCAFNCGFHEFSAEHDKV